MLEGVLGLAFAVTGFVAGAAKAAGVWCEFAHWNEAVVLSFDIRVLNEILQPIAFGLAIAATATGLSSRFSNRKRRSLTLEDRIRVLTDSLRQSAGLVSEIEREVEQRSTLASKLRADIDRANQLIDLRPEQVEAVAQILRSEVKGESRKSFWLQLLVNFLFFSAGVIVQMWFDVAK